MGNYNCFSWTRATPNFVLLNFFYYNGADEIWAEYHHFLWFYRRLSEPKLIKKMKKKNTQVSKNAMWLVNYFTIFVHIFHLSYASGSMSLYVKTSILSKSNNIFQLKKCLKNSYNIIYALMIEIHWIIILEFRVCACKVGQGGGGYLDFSLFG